MVLYLNELKEYQNVPKLCRKFGFTEKLVLYFIRVPSETTAIPACHQDKTNSTLR